MLGRLGEERRLLARLMNTEREREAWLQALRWVMTRPSLITGLPGDMGPLLEPEDRRLDALIQDTREDWSSLASRLTSHKLGLAFEVLIIWGMTRGLGWTLLGRDVQVFDERRTLGALDLIVRDTRGEVTHWELAYKLYLQRDEDPGWGSWLGPAGRDRLSLKLNHMLTHQLPLSSRPEAREALAALGVERIDHRRVMMQGTLFGPWGKPPSTALSGAFPAEGCWLREGAFKTLLIEHPHWTWVPRHKPLWFGLAPSRHDALSRDALLALSPLRESLLFSRLDDGREELTFVVPESWGAPTQEDNGLRSEDGCPPSS